MRKPPTNGQEDLTPQELLERIAIVLVEPQGPLNVGSTARAMANFGLRDLRLVGGPPLDHGHARNMAVHAGNILDEARQCTSLGEVLADTTFVVATTAKQRHRVPSITAEEAAERIIEEAAQGSVAILFGRENHGLDAEELALAHITVAVETSPECRALNISQAVLLLAYETYRASQAKGIRATSKMGRMLTFEIRNRLKTELLGALRAVNLLHDGTAIAMEQSIERILALAPMQSRDARVLFSLARRVQELHEDGGSRNRTNEDS